MSESFFKISLDGPKFFIREKIQLKFNKNSKINFFNFYYQIFLSKVLLPKIK